MELDVTLSLGKEDVACGRLYTSVRRGIERATFTYDPSYLARGDAFAISPDLPLGQASIHAARGSLFGAFEDCMQDRWGRNLMLRAERNDARFERRTARTLYEADYLSGVQDVLRQGALRMWVSGSPVAGGEGVPREVAVPHLLAQADLASASMDADVRDLLQAGSSLGGARPKASVRDSAGRLLIAKFPKADETLLDDTCAWEHVALTLAERCGIRVPRTRLIRVRGRSVLLLERFDRQGDVRIPYLSGMSAIQGSDGETYSYLELVDFLETDGAQTREDVRQLWRRMLFSCAIGNTDDHMRNHGFLRTKDGWALSPAFDVNPTEGDGEKYLSCALDFDECLASPAAALEVCDLYRTSMAEARAVALHMARELRAWKVVATKDGISSVSIARMQSCFQAGIARLEAL